jgi:peptide/nickel transport system ATP-binding protein
VSPGPLERSTPALELIDLEVAYRVRGRSRKVLRGVSLSIAPGESYGLVGESGCGKTTAAFAAIHYLPRNGYVSSGTVRVDGTDPYALSRRGLQQFHRQSISMVYQSPGTAMNPSIRIGRQVAEVFELLGSPRKEAFERAHAALQRVQIADAGSVMQRYPHQLSGGMQQRVVIAMALAKNPALLLLDEPTTGLDVTVEAEILDLIRQLQVESQTAALFITHNLGVIARMCQRVGVLYAGRLVEEGLAEDVLVRPRHPYTVGLIRCIPRRGVRKDRDRLDTIPGLLPAIGEELPGCVFADRCLLAEEICHQVEPELHELGNGHTSRCHFHERAGDLPRVTPLRLEDAPVVDRSGPPLLRVEGLTKIFRQHGNVHALTDVSALIWSGETLGLVGESGSGKSTFAHAVLGIVEPTSGAVELDGRRLAASLDSRNPSEVRGLQLVFQNPDAALNRSHRVDRILRHALKQLAGITGAPARERLLELASAVRLAERYLAARPRHLSGGLKQRVAIASAFAGGPRLVICDEPTSALDVSVQAAILNLLAELQAREKVSYIFISHDLGVVRYISDRIAVLYLGRLMEVGKAETVFSGPHHPYTESLLSALPTIDGTVGGRIRLTGEIPSAAQPPSGCVFHTRCHRKLGAICEQQEPPLLEAEPEHYIRCHIPLAELGRATVDRPEAGLSDDHPGPGCDIAPAAPVE